MTHVIHAKTGRDLVFKATRACIEEGVPVAPRGQPTLELSPAVLTLDAPSDVLATGIGREKLSAALAVAEGLQLVAGVAAPTLLCKIAPFYSNFVNPHTGTFDGAYGPRLHDAMPVIVQRLKADPDSRQAIAPIYNPTDTARTQSKDYPCTLVIHFMLRDKRLNMYVNMRSNDVWLGTTYDIYQFTTLHRTLARCLSVGMGKYVHYANSLHLYERNQLEAEHLHPPVSVLAMSDRVVPVRIGQPLRDWRTYRNRARLLLEGTLPLEPTTYEVWAHEVLAPFTGAEK